MEPAGVDLLDIASHRRSLDKGDGGVASRGSPAAQFHCLILDIGEARGQQVALLDNFCWGNPNLPDRLAGLVRAARGCHDAAVAWKAPYISGKDSLNNEFAHEGRSLAIPPTLLISAIGLVPDVRPGLS